MRPINRLPPELLAHVFSLVPRRRAADFGYWQYWPYRFRTVSQYDLPISVCRHWNRTALETPALWADICILQEQVSNYNRVHQQFPYSPLNLFIERYGGPWGARAVTLLREHGPRIRLLYLHIEHCDSDFGQETLHTICSLPAQDLQHCALGLRGIQSNESFRKLFAGHGANLRSLLLFELPFLPSNSFPALRRLILSPSNLVNWDMADLLKFLSRQPFLERCYLDFRRSTQKRVPPGLPLIHLNALRTISIGSHTLGSDTSISIIRALCTHVSVPNAIHRAVDVCSVNDFAALQSCLIPPRGASYTEFMVRSQELRFGQKDPPQTLSFHFGRSVFESSEDIKTLLSTSPLFSAVEECCIIAIEKLSCEWFTSLPFLRRLCAAMTVPYHNENSHKILRYLTHTPDAPAPCALLETLCLRIQGVGMRCLANIPAQLSAMLLSRRDAGCPIRQLVVGFARNADEDVDAQLREMNSLVDELVWFWNVGKDFDWLRHCAPTVSCTCGLG